MKRLSVLELLLGLCIAIYPIAAVNEGGECEADFWPQQLSHIESHIDDSVQPCDDFYEYACGNWRVSYHLRALNARDTLTMVKASNKRLLLQYFEKADLLHDSADTLPPHIQAAVNFYNSCLDERIRTPGKTDAIKVYSDVLLQFTQWPVLSASFSEAQANASFNWEHVSAQIGRYGVQPFWRLLVQPNWQSADQRIFYITPPTFEFLKLHSKASAFDENSAYLYKIYIKYLMLDLGVRVRQANEIAEEVIEFEKELLSLTTNERLVVLREPQTLQTVQDEFSGSIDLAKYFSTLLQEFSLPPDYAKELLIVADTTYLHKLARFLQTAKAETIGKYMLVQFLSHFEVHLHEDDSFKEQQADCLQQVHTFLPKEVSSLYLQLQHGSSVAYLQRTQTELNGIFGKLKVQFEKMLNATNIFDRDAVTKIMGLEKLRAMRLLLPNLEDVASENARLDFEIAGNYSVNLLNLSKLRTKRTLEGLLQPLTAGISPTAWTAAETDYGPLNVNAYYRLKKNAIEIPVGILRAPFYDACLDKAKIYGSFVYILGHELLHGFDYDGLNYDKSGNMGSNWGPKSIIQFGTKSGCYLSERYENAALTINENIADSEGLRLALLTFLETPVEEEQLKLFFISFAQTWCGTNALNRRATLHSDHRERVNNVLGNFPEFADTFKCRAGSALHPAEKCRIW